MEAVRAERARVKAARENANAVQPAVEPSSAPVQHEAKGHGLKEAPALRMVRNEKNKQLRDVVDAEGKVIHSGITDAEASKIVSGGQGSKVLTPEPDKPKTQFMAHIGRWLSGEGDRLSDNSVEHSRQLADEYRKAHPEEDGKKPYDGPPPGMENTDYLAVRDIAAENGVNLPDISRGKKALLSRLDMESRLGGLHSGAASAALSFISGLPDRYLADLGSSYLKRSLSGGEAVGSYSPVDRLITVSKTLLDSNLDPQRVIPHEISHHLERYVDKADLDALEKEYQRQRARLGPTVKISRDTIEHIGEGSVIGARGETLRTNRNQQEFMADSYRFKNFQEWFAESIADRALRDYYAKNAPAPARTALGRAVRAFQAIAKGAMDFLTRQGKHAPAEKIYQKLLKGQYDGAIKPPREGADLFMAHQKVEEAKSQIGKIADDLKRNLNPAARSEGAAVDARSLRHNLARETRENDVLDRKIEKELSPLFNKVFKTKDEREAAYKALWYAIEEGTIDQLPTKHMQNLAFLLKHYTDFGGGTVRLRDRINAQVAATVKAGFKPAIRQRINADTANYIGRPSIKMKPGENANDALSTAIRTARYGRPC